MSKGRRVYVVDDDATMQSSMVFVLSALNLTIVPYFSGSAFLNDIDRCASGCVLLDLRMPKMNGFEVLEAMGDRIKFFPVIVLTGFGDVNGAVRAMKLGASDFIEKPFDDEILFQTIDRVFAKFDMDQEETTKIIDARRRLAALTPRERTVLEALASGRSNKVIAYELNLSVRTVEVHRASMMARLGVRTLSGALQIAFLARQFDPATHTPLPIRPSSVEIERQPA